MKSFIEELYYGNTKRRFPGWVLYHTASHL